MNIATRKLGDITVVDIAGRLDTETSGPAADEMTRIAAGGANVLLNFAELEFLGSAGLRVVLRAAKQLADSGGQLKICSPSDIVTEILDISGFGNLLDIYPSEAEARAAF